MSNSFGPNIPNLILMIKPKSFGFNAQTAGSNSFQNNANVVGSSSKAVFEFEKMVSKIKANNIELKVFEDIAENLPDAVFPNNWISNIPEQAIVIYPMLTENRQKEVRNDVIEWALKELRLSNSIDLRRHDAILEGTGSIVFDHKNKTAFAAISPRTSLSLLNELCQSIGYQSCSFESVDLMGSQIYHTNVMMSIADQYAVVCLESVPDLLERAMLKNKLKSMGKELIEISYAQMNLFAGNVLEVISNQQQSYLLMSETAHKAFSIEQINQIEPYSKILSFDISTIERIGGGSVRCMLAGFFNYPK